jgi:cytochrome c oxidase cbb3-type subunit III
LDALHWGNLQLKKFALVATLVLAAVVLLKAQEGAPPASPAQGGRPGAPNAAAEAARAAATERGRALFKTNCAACHAEDATGGRGPDLIRSTLVRHDKNGDLIGPVITAGRVEKGMPPFPLAESQIADIVAFIQSQLVLFDLHTRFGPYPNDIPAERLATGTVEAGKAYFNGPGGCNKCHSPTGDLAGIAKKYNPPDLEVRFLYPSGTPTTAVVTLPSGQKFEGTLLLNDGFYVAIQGKDGWYHSWPRSAVKIEVHDPLVAHAALLQKYTDADMHNLFTYLETLK